MSERREWLRLAAPRAGEAGSRNSSSTSTSCSGSTIDRPRVYCVAVPRRTS